MLYDDGVSRVGAYVLAIMLAACSLIDPLDDISGGKRDAGAPSPTADAGPSAVDAEAPRDAETDGGITSFSCVTGTGTAQEAEPNDEPSSSNLLTSGQQICGVLRRGSGDKDIFALVYGQANAGPWQLVVTASEPLDIEMTDTDKLPVRRNFTSDSTPQRGFTNGSGVLQITLTGSGATDIAYGVTLTLPR